MFFNFLVNFTSRHVERHADYHDAVEQVVHALQKSFLSDVLRLWRFRVLRIPFFQSYRCCRCCSSRPLIPFPCGIIYIFCHLIPSAHLSEVMLFSFRLYQVTRFDQRARSRSTLDDIRPNSEFEKAWRGLWTSARPSPIFFSDGKRQAA